MDDVALLAKVLTGDDAAFAVLVTRYHPALIRVARSYVSSDAHAEDVAQDTWMGVLRGVHRFQARSGFGAWLFAILVNRARTTGARERRSVPVDIMDRQSCVDPARFDRAELWTDPPAPFTDRVETAADLSSLVKAVRAAIAELPQPQRAVVSLRDVAGLSTTEVAGMLGLSEPNVRVILHRGRAKVRSSTEGAAPATGREPRPELACEPARVRSSTR